ncbi:Bifunctional inhibitor/lipid-transfer protein/seed storage 2S albumin superfamily protein [Abeliophyllum distichum]|uniref:Bifunctional inhibitor/lipid-transfer protein/seed storage 2S albumin superfamily protein n=1 Tax=Abeliophyllum distichum TaxID=126358 RepID=A0ABD1Q8C7_9LAMI
MTSSSIKPAFTTAALMVAVLVIATGMAEGQSDCVSKLIDCANYLNSTKPSATCCNAIKDVVSTQLPCLCNLYNSPGLLGGINMTQALELPKHCGLTSDTSVCKASSPTSSAVPPPGVPGGKDKNGVSKSISSMGMPSLVLLLAIVLFH